MKERPFFLIVEQIVGLWNPLLKESFVSSQHALCSLGQISMQP
jgi:hypothetical protein